MSLIAKELDHDPIRQSGKAAHMLFTRVSGIGASQLAERAFAVAQDHAYHRGIARLLRGSAAGIFAGVIGICIALWQLRFGGILSPQAAQFWLLCLVLSGGVAGVALLTAAGSLIEQFAIVRLAIARKENDVLEAIQERYELFEQCEAFYDLLEEVGSKKQEPLGNEIVRESLGLIIRHTQREAEFRRGRPVTWDQLEPRWRALGASVGLLRRFRGFHDPNNSDEEDDRSV